MTSKTLITVSIFFNTLVAVWRAYLANHLGNNKWVPLPPVALSKSSLFSMEQMVDLVDRIVHVVIFNTAHPCLYYSYARSVVLRKNGYPVQLNLGMHNLQTRQQPEGHCWISSKGRALFEEKDPREMYPEMLGERDDVVYWTRLKGEAGKDFARMKKG